MDELRGKKLEEMLVNYQQMAMNSLGGPASAWRGIAKPTNGHTHKFGTLAGNQMSKALLTAPPVPRKVGTELPFDFKLLPQQNFPVLPPYFMRPDVETDTGGLIYCELEDAHIAGFVIGGEERLCLPPILHTVLKEIDLMVINEACDALLIHCSRCTSHQLRLLKQDNILPANIASAGLIRKTDAERLCTLLLHNFKLAPVTDPDQRVSPQINSTCLPVYHECFGEGHGFLYTELYTNPYSRCISCADCEKLFNPERFVTHTHFNQENKICHWGFNRRNWRNYLLLSDEQIGDDEMKTMNETFQSVLYKYRNCARKRKPVISECVSGEAKLGPSASWAASYNTVSSASSSPSIKRRCNRPPMRAYQYVKGSPTVENPDLVVAHSDKHLYNKHFVPNVCIKAESPISSSSADSSQEEVIALDLRSPGLRERHSSVCSNQSATNSSSQSAPAKEQTEVKEIEEKVSADEILDVESSDDYPKSVQPPKECSESETNAVTTSCTQTENDAVTDFVEKLETIFGEVLTGSCLTEEQKKEKMEAHKEYILQIRRSLV